MFTSPLQKIIISLLSLCLVVIVGLYLYSVYSPKADAPSAALPTSQTNSESATPNVKQQVETPAKSTSSTAQPVTSEPAQQPDKSLPVPAHQLKKALAEQPEQNELDEKIKAANQAIAEIDKRLPQGANPTAPSSTEPSTTASDDDLSRRLEHLKNHLNNNQ